MRMRITDPRRLRASALSMAGRLSVWSMVMMSRCYWLPVFSTTVDSTNRTRHNQILHTTRISILGITLFRGQETILLDDDGQSFRMKGTQSLFPLFWKKTRWEAHGAVSGDHDGAVYHIPFFGEMLDQHTRMTRDGLLMVQTTPFSRAVILLQRLDD